MKNLLFLDTETTGITEKNGIIQISGFIDKVNSINDIEQVEKFNHNCNIYDGEVIEESALKVNGHTIEQIKEYENPKTTFKNLDTVLSRYHRFNHNYVLVAFNARFDYGFMERWYDKGSPLNSKNKPSKRFFHLIGAEVIDVLTLVVELFLWQKIKLENYKLETLAKYFKIDHKAHDAFSDIEVTREIFYRYSRMKLNKLNFQSMFLPFEFKKEELVVIE